LRFSKAGRARFIAHLDTLTILVRAIRRAGFELAVTEGMRPKPVLSLAMPLGVGVEGEDEICDFALRQRAPLDQLAERLAGELPEDFHLKSVSPTYERSKSAARVDRVSYRIEFMEEVPEAAMRAYNEAASLVILRRRPKGDKEVDIKKYVPVVARDGASKSICFDMIVAQEGTARPEEIAQALQGFSDGPLEPQRFVRTQIHLRDEVAPAPGRQRGGSQRRRR
jgi:radical SAM-linked protein